MIEPIFKYNKPDGMILSIDLNSVSSTWSTNQKVFEGQDGSIAYINFKNSSNQFTLFGDEVEKFIEHYSKFIEEVNSHA